MQQSKRMSMNECNEAMMMLKQKHEAELAFIGARQHEEWSQLVRLIACNHQETNDNSDDVIMSEGKSKKKVHYALHVVDKRKNVPDEKMECKSLSGLTFVKHKQRSLLRPGNKRPCQQIQLPRSGTKGAQADKENELPR